MTITTATRYEASALLALNPRLLSESRRQGSTHYGGGYIEQYTGGPALPRRSALFAAYRPGQWIAIVNSKKRTTQSGLFWFASQATRERAWVLALATIDRDHPDYRRAVAERAEEMNRLSARLSYFNKHGNVEMAAEMRQLQACVRSWQLPKRGLVPLLVESWAIQPVPDSWKPNDRPEMPAWALDRSITNGR